MENEKYCKECKKPTGSYRVGSNSHCIKCGVMKGKSKDYLSKLLGWVFIIGWVGFGLFFILWLIK